jgi:hypothetical protein
MVRSRATAAGVQQCLNRCKVTDGCDLGTRRHARPFASALIPDGLERLLFVRGNERGSLTLDALDSRISSSNITYLRQYSQVQGWLSGHKGASVDTWNAPGLRFHEP